MGEDDVTNDRTISEQPYAGVLFKSQNASTWTADQYEDLKFILYKAKFNASGSGTAIFNNSELAIGNSGIAQLRANPIKTLKPEIKIILSDHIANFTIGAEVTQTDTSPVPSAIIREVVQGVQGSSNAYIIVDDVGGTFREGVQSGANWIYRLVSSRSTANLTLTGVTGTFQADTAIENGTGASGMVTGWTSGTGVLEIKSVTGTFADGDAITQEIGGSTTGSGTIGSSGVALSGDDINDYPAAPISYYNQATEVTIMHANHCMHDAGNNVKIDGVISEVAPTVIDSAYHTNGLTEADGVSGTFQLHVADASAFHTTISGAAVATSNPGYIIIRDPEVGQRHFDGIPLVEINKLHTAIGSPTLDSYKVAVTSVSTNGITNGGWDVTATQNVQFEQFYPQLQTTVYPETDIIPRLNVVSATSIKDGSNTDEASFINDGVYLDCIANEDNYLTFPKLICSKVNEDAKLAGSKSLTMQLLMSTANENISPVVDTDRCSMITTTNRINEISSTNSNAESNTGDLNDAVYITKVMNLLQPANTLKVQFEAWRHPDTEIHVMYRIQPVGSSLAFSEIGYTYFNGNGKEDKTVQKTEAYLLRDLVYTYNGPEFISAQVKIIMTSKNQSYVPSIKNLRCMALSDL